MAKEMDTFDELRTRSDSLTPPYPTFGEHVRAILKEGWKEKDVVELVNGELDRAAHSSRHVSETAVNAWAADSAISTSYNAAIKAALGYDLNERKFYEAAHAVGFSPDNLHPTLQKIRSNEALCTYLTSVIVLIGLKMTGSFFLGEQAGRNLYGFIRGEKGLLIESVKKILARLPELPYHLDATILSVTTPRHLIASVLRDCRLRANGTKEKYVIEQLGIATTSDPRYWSYFEDNIDKTSPREDGEKGQYFKDPERIEKLCEKLTAERERFGIAPEVPAFLASHVSATAVVAPHAVAELIDQEESEVPVPASKLALEVRIAELERLVAALQKQITQLRTSGTLARPPQNAASDDYQSPLDLERFRTHDASIDRRRTNHTEMLIRVVIEDLAFYATMRDDAERGEVRKQLSDLLLGELFSAMEAFSFAHPRGVLPLIIERRLALRGNIPGANKPPFGDKNSPGRNKP